MNSQGPSSRGRPLHPRGHRPHRGGGGGRGRGTRGGPRGSGHGNHHRGSGRGGNHHSATPFTSLSDPSQDPHLAPRPLPEGFFHASFVENPWYELEEKMGIPHIKSVVPQRNASTQDKSQTAAMSIQDHDAPEAPKELQQMSQAEP